MRLPQEIETSLPIRLRDPEIPLRAWHAAAGGIGNALGHRSHRKAPVETEAVAAQVSPRILVKVEGMEGAAEARL